MQRSATVSVTAILFLLMTGSAAMADWNSCMGCHNGAMAPGKDSLKQKYPSVEAFVKAALESPSPLMKSVQQDENALRESARAIGLQ